MSLVDANILLYAEDRLSLQHERARQWWDERLSGKDPVNLSWTVLNAFIRIATNRRVFKRPLTMKQAVERVNTWLQQPCTRLITPTQEHWRILQKMLTRGQAIANLVTDAHLASLAVAHGCVLYSTDQDFARFPGLKWQNPLS